jgi:hypothetical protein
LDRDGLPVGGCTMTLTPAQIAFISLCGVLALCIVYEVYAPIPTFAVPEISRQERPIQAPPQPFFAPPPSSAFGAINDRPIFSQSRHSVAPAPVGAAAAPPPPPTVALIGVIIDSQSRLALVKIPSSPLETSVAVGGSVGGWQVSEIAPDKIVLHLGAAVDEVKLESNRAKDADGSNAQAMMKIPQSPVIGPVMGAQYRPPLSGPAIVTAPAPQLPSSTNGTDNPN